MLLWLDVFTDHLIKELIVLIVLLPTNVCMLVTEFVTLETSWEVNRLPTSQLIFNWLVSHRLYLTHEKKAGNDPVIIPYKVINNILTNLFGIITGYLSAKFS